METGIKSSFIPQSPITPSRTEARRGGRFDFFTLIALVIFVASATLGAAIFLYAQFLQTSANSKLEQLERAKQAFDPALIQDLTRLDDRMRTADKLLETHLAPTTLFFLLEKLTLQTVAFSSFDFSTSDDDIKLTMRGIAQSVNSIALQADYLSRSGVITNPIFSNINRTLGGVQFDFVSEVNAAALSYAVATMGLQGPTEQAPAPMPQEPASPFGTPGSETQTQTAPAQTP